MSSHPICDAIDAGHEFADKINEKEVAPDKRHCKIDNEPWPCIAIRKARRENAQQAGATSGLRPLLNVPKKIGVPAA